MINRAVASAEKRTNNMLDAFDRRMQAREQAKQLRRASMLGAAAEPPRPARHSQFEADFLARLEAAERRGF